MSDAIRNETVYDDDVEQLVDDYYAEQEPEQGDGEVVEGDVSQEEATPEVPDISFNIGGESKAFTDLDPNTVKEWYETYTNKDKWTRSNTQKAQELAEQRKQWEEQHPEYERQVQEYKQWENILQSDPELTQIIASRLQQKLPQGQGPQIPQQQQQYAQLPPEVQQQLKELNEFKRKQEVESEQARIDRERAEAIDNIRQKDPNFNETEFESFMTEATSNAGNLKQLYQLVYDAYKGRNIDKVKKEARNETIKDIKDKKVAEVQTGNSTSINSLPNNTNVANSLDDIFENFANEQGLQ